jgi:hypothetical protein
MAQRGRKSAAALSVVPGIPGGRPEPPEGLTEEQAEVWRSIVATKPADWFERDTHKLLVSYCKHASIASALDREIDTFDPEWLRDKEGLDRYKSLTDMREKHTRALTALSRSMRLTHQSQYRAESAATKQRKSAKPWEA